MTKNEIRLIDSLLAKSTSTEWDIAKLEWELTQITVGSDTCSCGKTSIHRICLLTNVSTLQTAILGSTCVEKYLYINCEHIFKDVEKGFGNRFVKLTTLEFAYSRKYISEWEFNVYNNLRSWKKLSDKQKVIRDKVNSRVSKLLESWRVAPVITIKEQTI